MILMKSKTNWDKLKKLSDKDIEAAAIIDPDASILSARKIKQFKRVNPVRDINLK